MPLAPLLRAHESAIGDAQRLADAARGQQHAPTIDLGQQRRVGHGRAAAGRRRDAVPGEPSSASSSGARATVSGVASATTCTKPAS
ncbi:MAG: hypothetical protein U0168_10225 [Nannocystaceae bacterium]